MKKLTIADIKATEILSKDERKMVVGGVIGGSGHPSHRQCKISDCSVTYTDYRGQQQTDYGKCQQYNTDSNTIECYCDAQPSDQKIISNGGLSNCWA